MTEVHSPIYMKPAEKSDKGALAIGLAAVTVVFAGMLCIGLQIGEQRLEETAIYSA